MKWIGITGGVGAGKSRVLSCLAERCKCRILLADDAANELKKAGQPCYGPLVELLGEEVLDGDGEIDRGRMAARIFGDGELLAKVNAIIHPAVKRYILQEVERERLRGWADYFFLEAALLIEDGYEELLDGLWYIHAEEEVRRERLKSSRGYTDEKIDRILASQLSEAEFRRHSDAVIENNGDIEETCRQIDLALERLAAER